MRTVRALVVPVVLTLTGCAGLTAPSADKLAALPVVTYPDKPAGADYVYRIPAGKPVQVTLRADGSALEEPASQTVDARLRQDLYLYKRWASSDGRTWQPADRLVGVNLSVALPSWETPGPGDIHLTVDSKAGQ